MINKLLQIAKKTQDCQMCASRPVQNEVVITVQITRAVKGETIRNLRKKVNRLCHPCYELVREHDNKL